MRFILAALGSLIVLPMLLVPLNGCSSAVVGTTAASASYVQDRRTVGTFLDDQTIGVKAKMAIASNKALWESSHIDVVTYNNILLLVGQTPSAYDKDVAYDLVRSIPGVRKVYNEITVEKPVTLSTRVNDSLITSKAKLNILRHSDLGLNRVRVTTENGVVFLMGLTTSEEEDDAIDIVRNIPGVKKVVKIFEDYS